MNQILLDNERFTQMRQFKGEIYNNNLFPCTAQLVLNIFFPFSTLHRIPRGEILVNAAEVNEKNFNSSCPVWTRHHDDQWGSEPNLTYLPIF